MFDNAIDEPTGGADNDADRGIGVCGLEPGYRIRSQVQGGGVDHPDPKPTDLAVAVGSDFVLQGGRHADDLAGSSNHHRPDLRQPSHPAVRNEEGDADQLLDAVHRLGKRTLADTKLGSGVGERRVGSHRRQITELSYR